MPTSAWANAGASLIPSPAIDDATLLAQLTDPLVFALRLDSGFDFIDPQLLGSGVGGARVIACHHDDFQSEPMQMRNRFRR
jgi:hypothetical protein